jgi:hypothetical protein
MSSFRVGEFDVDVVKRIEQKRKEYPLCDENGQEVIAERTTGKTTYKNKEGVIISKTYRLINEKPFDKFKKTKKVGNFEDVPKTEVYDLIQECCYLCKCEELRKQLQKGDKARKFIYTCGNGFKSYISYLMPFQDNLIMVCGFGSITQQIKEIEDNRKDIEVEVSIGKVETANPEELLLLN